MFAPPFPTVSALVSVYSGTNCLDFSRAFGSLVNSRWIPDQFVIVIDGPIDSDLRVYVDSLRNFGSVTIINLEYNCGLGVALHRGLAACECDFIMRFDSDDINLPGRLQSQLQFFLENNNVDVVGSYVLEFNPNNPSDFGNTLIKKVPLDDCSIKAAMAFRNPINHPSVMFKRTSIESIGSYEDLRYFEDYYLWLKARRAGLVFANISVPMVKMARVRVSERRSGVLYFRCELKFVLTAARHCLLTPFEIFSLIMRSIIRVLPFPDWLLVKLMFWRASK